MIDAARIADALQAAGLPVSGVRVVGGRQEVMWSGTPTVGQRAAADSILADPEYGPRRPRPLADVLTDLQGLTQQEVQAIVLRQLAEALARDPGLGRRAGVPVDGDEPIPQG